MLVYDVTASLLLIVCTVFAAKPETTPAAAMVMPANFSFAGSKLMTMAGVKMFCMTVLVFPSMMSQCTSTSESNLN